MKLCFTFSEFALTATLANNPGGNQGNNNNPGGSDYHPGENQDWIDNDSNYNDPTHKHEATVINEFTVTTEPWQDTDKPTIYEEYVAGHSYETCQYSTGKTIEN